MPITIGNKAYSDADLRNIASNVANTLVKKGDCIHINEQTTSIRTSRKHATKVAADGLPSAPISRHKKNGMPVFSCIGIDPDGNTITYEFCLSDSLRSIYLMPSK